MESVIMNKNIDSQENDLRSLEERVKDIQDQIKKLMQ